MGKQVKTCLNKIMAGNNNRNNNNINKEDLFAESGFEGRSWKVVSSQKVSESSFAGKVDRAIVRDGHFTDEDGNERTIKNVVLIMTNGKSKSWKLSPLQEQYKAGTKLDVDSLELQKLMDEETGDVYYNMNAEVE